MCLACSEESRSRARSPHLLGEVSTSSILPRTKRHHSVRLRPLSVPQCCEIREAFSGRKNADRNIRGESLAKNPNGVFFRVNVAHFRVFNIHARGGMSKIPSPLASRTSDFPKFASALQDRWYVKLQEFWAPSKMPMCANKRRAQSVPIGELGPVFG